MPYHSTVESGSRRQDVGPRNSRDMAEVRETREMGTLWSRTVPVIPEAYFGQDRTEAVELKRKMRPRTRTLLAMVEGL